MLADWSNDPSWMVPEVEPLRPPTLNRFSHREVEVVNFLSSDKADSSDDMRAVAPAVALDEEYLHPQTPVGVDAEKGLANSDENCQIQNKFWHQLLELNAVGEEEASHGAEKPET
jgi:hypothetical protein